MRTYMKNKAPSSTEFVRFLSERYGMSNIAPFSCVNNAEVSTLYLGKTTGGTKVIIKWCADGELCANEHARGAELYRIDKRYFAEQICYSDTPPFCFTAQAYLPGIRIIEAIKAHSLTDEQNAVLIEDLYNNISSVEKIQRGS